MQDPSPTPTQITLTPYFSVKNADRAISFYVAAFGASEIFRLTDPSGKIAHAELDIRGATVMLSDEHPDYGALSPASLGGSPVKFHLLVDDAQSFVDKAVVEGAILTRPLTDEFYGERSAMLTDPFGHQWFVAQTIEAVSPDEMQRRWTAMISDGA